MRERVGVTVETGRPAAGGPGRRGLGARHALGARPADRRRRIEEGVTYDLATGLLGLHPRHPARRGRRRLRRRGHRGTVFGVVDKVIETGQDPRRFTEDLLRRLRDLVIINGVSRTRPTTGHHRRALSDQGERLVVAGRPLRRAPTSARAAGPGQPKGLTEHASGATAPRLLLELICARVLLPGADHESRGVGARAWTDSRSGCPSTGRRPRRRRPGIRRPSPPPPTPPSPAPPSPAPPSPRPRLRRSSAPAERVRRGSRRGSRTGQSAGQSAEQPVEQSAAEPADDREPQTGQRLAGREPESEPASAPEPDGGRADAGRRTTALARPARAR